MLFLRSGAGACQEIVSVFGDLSTTCRRTGGSGCGGAENKISS